MKQSKGEYFLVSQEKGRTLRIKNEMHQSVCDGKEGVYVNPFTHCMLILHLN